MKKILKRSVSCLLVCIFILSSISTVFAAVPLNGKRETEIPTVYVAGYGSPIYKNKDNKNSGSVYSSTILSDATFKALLNGFSEPLMYGIKTDNWDPYCDFIVDTCKEDMSSFRLDDNGNVFNGSGNDCIQDKNVYDRVLSDGKYNFFTYQLIYDWRIDPFVVAAQLNDYIKDVKRVTGASKVNLVGRCLGGNMVMTYLHEYGYDDVNAVSFYIGLFDGCDMVGALFSGKVDIDPDALQQFIDQKVPDANNDSVKFLKNILALINAMNMLNLPISLVEKVYGHIYQNVIPRLMKISYGTLPSFWSFVGSRYYEDAKSLIFGGEEEKYQTLIDRIDRYHYDIFEHTTDILKEGMRQGVNFYNFVKYGGAMAPVCKEAVYCSDGTTTVRSQSFGSVSSEITAPFGCAYLNAAEKNGMAQYISADAYVDASGDILRDHTWFIKGPEHIIMPESVNILMANIMDANGPRENSNYITTDYFENYPQFLLASANSSTAEITPLVDENKNDGEKWNENWFTKLMHFIRGIINFFKRLFEFK